MEAADIGETDCMSADESAVVPVDVGSREHAHHSGHAANPRPDAKEKRKPVTYRVFKTLCLYVSFATMVR